MRGLTAILPLLLIAALTACNKPRPTLVVDAPWHQGMAEQMCELATAWRKENADLLRRFSCARIDHCPEMMRRIDACHNVQGSVFEFENDLSAAFALNPDCHGVDVVYFRRPDGGVRVNDPFSQAKGTVWVLMVDFTPGDPQQNWALNLHGNPPTPLLDRTGPPASIAKDVCAAVLSRGATVTR